MSWRPISSTYLKPEVVTSAVGGVLPSRMALVAVVVPWNTRRMSGAVRPACPSTFLIAVMKPPERSPGVEGVFATHVLPVPESAKVISVNVPPTSIAIVPVSGMPAIVDEAIPTGRGRRDGIARWSAIHERLRDVASAHEALRACMRGDEVVIIEARALAASSCALGAVTALLDTLGLLGGVVAVPALLLGLFALFAWRYRRAVAASMAARAGASSPGSGSPARDAPTPDGSRRSALPLRDVALDEEALASPGARAALELARARDRGARLAFAVAGAVYWIATGATVSWLTRDWPRLAMGIEAWLSALPVLVVVGALTIRSWRTRIGVALAYLAIGAALVPVGGAGPWRRDVAALALTHAVLPAAGLALLLARRLRPLLVALVAVLVYVAAGAALASLWLGGRDLTDAASGVRWSWTPMAVAGVLAHVIGIAVFVWALRRRWVGRVLAGLVILAALADAVDRLTRASFPLGPIAFAIPGVVVQLGVVWLVFKGLVWLQDRRVVAPQVLHFDVAIGFLALYHMTIVSALGREGSEATVAAWMVPLAFALAVGTLHLGLRYVRSRRREGPVPRLLFLRVFGSAGQRERLLDVLDDTWCRVGRIDLVGGTDLALRTLSSRMLEAFLLRRVETGFLRTPEQVGERLGRLDQGLGGDARHPVNELYCHADVWPSAVTRLAPESDVVLMDLRGFTRANRGCEFELTQLIWTVPMASVLLLTDADTDESALARVVDIAWAALPPASPNAAARDAALYRMEFADGRGDRASALVRALFGIAFPRGDRRPRKAQPE